MSARRDEALRFALEALLAGRLTAVDPSAWHARAFGLDLSARFPVPGLDHLPSVLPAQRAVRLELVTEFGLRSAWPATGARRVIRQLRPAMSLFEHDDAGYLLETESHGTYSFGADGSHVTCAPPETDLWRWQRFLTGQVLPLAALLRGLEVFHASAVALDGGAVAFIGDSGAGKTSVAIHLMLAGAPLLTDDVLVVAPEGGDGVSAHPAAGLLNLRHIEDARLGPRRAALGTALGEDRKGVRLRVDRSALSLPPKALYVLERGAPVQRTSFDPVEDASRRLLASTFNFAIRTPARMVRQLDMCARLATCAPLFRARVPSSVGAAELARQVEHHVREDRPANGALAKA